MFERFRSSSEFAINGGEGFQGAVVLIFCDKLGQFLRILSEPIYGAELIQNIFLYCRKEPLCVGNTYESVAIVYMFACEDNMRVRSYDTIVIENGLLNSNERFRKAWLGKPH